GLLLFRRSSDCVRDDRAHKAQCKDDWKEDGLARGYREGLVVFVVGEDATQGIHRDQFRNALSWIDALRHNVDPKQRRIGVLGPTFSGSLPSITQLMSDGQVKDWMNLPKLPAGVPAPTAPINANDSRFAIYSGSVSSKGAAEAFQATVGSDVKFYSFVQNDDEILRRFCTHMKAEQPRLRDWQMAMISEDETAYGGTGVSKAAKPADYHITQAFPPIDDSCEHIQRLYYPRDISALREAYQSKSLFDVGAPGQAGDAKQRNLPTDLADPSGKVHDSIRSYGGNQTPQAQEAFLLNLAAVLREE